MLTQEYIRTARAKGASGLRVMFIHALRSGLLPAVSYLGPAFAALITGSFVVETCFQVPGMGLHFVNATTDGVVRPPFSLGIMVGLPPSTTQTQLLVVPKSIPIVLPMINDPFFYIHPKQHIRAMHRPIQIFCISNAPVLKPCAFV